MTEGLFDRLTRPLRALAGDPPAPQRLSERVSVAGQIRAEDLEGLKANGLRSVICNRPDVEVGAELRYDVIAAEAARVGLEVAYLPVTSPTVAQAQELGALLEQMPAPALIYCRSGARSTMLWQMAGQP